MRISLITQGLEESNLEQHLTQLLSDRAVTKCRALVAFVTLDGLLRLGLDPEGLLRRFVESPDKYFELVVCVDTITTADALRELLRLGQNAGQRFSLKAYKGRLFGPDGRFFHPKVYIFERDHGEATILIGSNNLTPGGLSKNVEVAIRLDEVSAENLAPWNRLWNLIMLETHDVDTALVEIIQKIRKAQRQRLPHRARRQRIRVPTIEVPKSRIPPLDEPSPMILIRYVPRAGGRTSQVHFTRKIVEDYFHLRLGQSSQLRLQQVQPASPPSPIENRVLVYSQRNKNPKIEVLGVKVIGDYGKNQLRPILLFLEIKRDFFRYMLVLPNDAGYSELAAALQREPRHGLALRYKITDLDTLLQIWPDYPH